MNLTGFFWKTQRVIAEMVTRYGGHVVNITTLVDNASSSSPPVLTALTKGGHAAATWSPAARLRTVTPVANRSRPAHSVNASRMPRRTRGKYQ